MKKDQWILWLKNNWVTSLLMLFLAIILFFPNAKAWMLQQAINTGIVNANIDNTGNKNGNIQSTPFNYTNTSGVVSSTNDLTGKVVFINFWASWCPPCRAEMPSLNNLYSKFKNDDRVVFLFITEDEDQRKAVDYLNKSNFHFPVYTLAGNIDSKLYSGTLPTTIVLNKKGEVVYNHQGIAGYNTNKFVQQLKELL